MIYKSSINKGFKKLIKFRLGCLINMILNVVVPPTPQKLKRYKIICSVFLFLNFEEITEK